jgi:prolyl oligopeptidase
MKKSLAFITFCLLSLSLSAQWKYPSTKKVDVTDTYFGTTYHDNYRWLEDLKNPVVIQWFKDQATLTNATLNKLNGRDELIAEWKKLDKLQPPSYRNPVKEGNRIFYQKKMPGDKVSKVYYREGIEGKEQLLFDPLTFIAGKTLSVQSIIPSFDAKKLAIAYSADGAEVSTIQIINVDTKQFLPDIITASAGVSGWTFDNTAILYMWLKSADNTDPTSRLSPKTKLHKLGTAVTADIDFFSDAGYPELKIPNQVYPSVFLVKDANQYVFAALGSVEPEQTSYYAPIAQFNSAHIQWKKLSSVADKLVRGFDVAGDMAYAITYNGAKNYKLVATDLKNPNWANAKTIAPEKKNQTLESFTRCKDYLLVVYSDGINSQLDKYNLKTGVITQVKLPFTGVVDTYCMDTKTNECKVGIISWTKPYAEFMLDTTTDTFKASPFNKPAVLPEAYKNLVVEEVEVKGHDGVMIPLSIIYKKGLKKDGSNVCLMDSYGAYGYSMTPWFDAKENSLAVRGVVVAIPHVRGGSEKGQDWYKAGYKTTKPNTWKDFNSCAEYLIAQGYTSSKRLAGTGTSAGGVLITRAITERPDLYAAAICNVGCANASRGEFSANGPVNTPEFGTVAIEEECKALYEMDGMQHVQDGVKYPAIICVGGWNDPRVVAWQPGKFAAAAQNATASGKPVFMKVNYDNGHFTEDKDVTFANFADQFAFVLWQCGHPGFQMKP